MITKAYFPVSTVNRVPSVGENLCQQVELNRGTVHMCYGGNVITVDREFSLGWFVIFYTPYKAHELGSALAPNVSEVHKDQVLAVKMGATPDIDHTIKHFIRGNRVLDTLMPIGLG